MNDRPLTWRAFCESAGCKWHSAPLRDRDAAKAVALAHAEEHDETAVRIQGLSVELPWAEYDEPLGDPLDYLTPYAMRLLEMAHDMDAIPWSQETSGLADDAFAFLSTCEYAMQLLRDKYKIPSR